MKKVQSTPNMPPNIPPTTGAAARADEMVLQAMAAQAVARALAGAGGGVVIIGLIAFFAFRGGPTCRPRLPVRISLS